MNFKDLPYLDHFEIEKCEINDELLDYFKLKYGIDIPSDFIKFLSEVGNMTMNQSEKYILMPTFEGLIGEHFDGIMNSFLNDQIIEHLLNSETIMNEKPYYDIIVKQNLLPVGSFCFAGQRMLFMGYGKLNYNMIFVYDYELSDNPVYVTNNIEAFFKDVLYVDDYLN